MFIATLLVIAKISTRLKCHQQMNGYMYIYHRIFFNHEEKGHLALGDKKDGP